MLAEASADHPFGKFAEQLQKEAERGKGKIKVIESGTGKYLVINDDEKLPIHLNWQYYDVEGLTQTDLTMNSDNDNDFCQIQVGKDRQCLR